MKVQRITLVVKSLLVISLIAILLVAGLVSCDDKDEIVTDNDILKDGTYKWTGLQAKIPMHPENFGDTVIIEKTNGVYYITVKILNTAKVERFYWKRGDANQDCVKTDLGLNEETGFNEATYMFAFDNTQIQKKLKFQIGGGKMPLDPPFEFKIDFEALNKVSDTVANTQRPSVYVEKKAQ